MERFALDPIGVFTLSVRQLISRIGYLIVVNIFGILFSIPIVTIPAARTAVLYAVREGLLDPFQEREQPLRHMLDGLRLFWWKSTLLALMNMAFLLLIMNSFLFWASQSRSLLIYLSAISVYALIFWLLCQPSLFVVLVHFPERRVMQAWQQTFRIVFRRPIYTIIMVMIILLLRLVSLLLLGPYLLISGVLIALIIIQATWVMLGEDIPDLMDPMDFLSKQEQRKQEQQEKAVQNGNPLS